MEKSYFIAGSALCFSAGNKAGMHSHAGAWERGTVS